MEKLESVEKTAIEDQLPHYTRLSYNEFSQCQNCQQNLLEGSTLQTASGAFETSH